MRNETKREIRKLIIAVIEIFAIAAVIVGAIIGTQHLALAEKKTVVIEYPMANAHISWEQTFHPGAWNE